MPPTTPNVPLVRRSLAGWAALAATIVVASYVFTLLLAVACAYLPYLLLTSPSFSGFQALGLAACGLVMSATILWSLVPRRDRFVAPGVPLDRSIQPRLFAELESIANALNEPMPQDVYITLEVNAWVAERGGTMGFRSRRVMGLGLPLLQTLTVPQFRAVVAHEFGHYYCGDTRLGPWVYKTRDAMVRTLVRLSSDSELMNVLTRVAFARLAHHLVIEILNAYWKLFMRATQMISRKQEYRADELACHVAGSEALIEGLGRIAAASPALRMFWQTEVVPTLSAGYHMPIADGFARFLTAPAIAGAMSKHLETVLHSASTQPYDTHPTLRDRIAAARLLPTQRETRPAPPAISLFDDINGVELQILANLNHEKAATLKTSSWERVGPEVYVPMWRAEVRQYSFLLAGLTVDCLPDAVGKLREMSASIRDPTGMLLTREQRVERAASLLWMALTLALITGGWNLHPEPGELYLEQGER